MKANPRLGALLSGLFPRLEKISDTPELDACVLAASVLQKPRSWVMAHPEAVLTSGQAAVIEEKAQRLEGGEPLPYVLGRWEFFGLEFEVNPAVLIPRPETELLVEQAIGWIRKQGGKEQRVVDIGAGCGCIAIALAVNIPGLHVLGTDISPAAIEVARQNAEKLNVSDRVSFVVADLFPEPPFPPSYSLVLSNPPYIPTQTLRQLPIYGREPTLALDGGADGLSVIRRLLERAAVHLAPGGLLLMEIEASEGAAVFSLAQTAFPNASIRLHKDLAGHERLLEVQRPG